MFTETITRYEDELRERVIPFWMNNCIDRECGGFFTSLDRDGSVYDTTKYMWMQWRIVYMFGELYLDPRFRRGEFLEIAERGFEFLYRHGRDERGWYYFALNRRGEPAMAPYSVYSDCFAAMGCAVLYKATGNEEYRRAAREAMGSYLARIESGNPAGQWNKGLPGKQSYLSLGFYMMLANLGLLLDDCLGSDDYRGELDRALDLVLTRFWRPERGLVFENVLPDGTPDLESAAGRMLNPGHVLEAMWFLLNALERRGGDPGREAEIRRIILATLKFGWDSEHGGIFYFMDALGKPHIELQHDMKLWWVHNEALIATLYAYKSGGEPEFLDWFHRLDEWSWSHFPDPEYGEWYAYLNRRGEPTSLMKGGKWKTFFHLPRALMISSKLMHEINSDSRRRS